jgi:hypothetical protein
MKANHKSQVHHTMNTVNSTSSGVQASRILNHQVKILKIMYHYKVIKKQICDVQMFKHHVVVLPAATGSTTCHTPSHRYHYSRIFDHIMAHIQTISSINLLYHLQRLHTRNKQKHIWVSKRILLMKLAVSC